MTKTTKQDKMTTEKRPTTDQYDQPEVVYDRGCGLSNLILLYIVVYM